MYIIIINNYSYIIISKHVSLVKKIYQILRKYVCIRKEDLLYYYRALFIIIINICLTFIYMARFAGVVCRCYS